MGFYKFILVFLHILLYIRAIILLVWEAFRNFTTGIFGARGNLKEIHLHSKSLQTLPSHISLVILEQAISFSDVAKLVVWCMAMGIKYISVYDHKGILKGDTAKLSSEIIYKQKEVFAKEAKRYTFVLRNSRTKFDHTLAPTQVCITVLSAEDGKQDIVEAAQEFCMSVKQKKYSPKQLDTDLFNDMLKATTGLPDPDLALKFGAVSSVMGFLPWQIRLTEFLTHQTHHNVKYSAFLQSLQKYSRCEKRFGK
ncbi:predicted protein [Nematostella vectensis]|uniref:ditrans,polycis-polyprenyl diphosphate synthase [(2E,6E)-farnesyldiphosphate specific] n=1 Tax=Nematostella vectensis TaxID=45351 RepID=A7S2R9_NEMVE|nr:predicted protein [Nematostella vectensis]|eukprot:XP_001634035.1 predicted protein [Nematostella vectensis]